VGQISNLIIQKVKSMAEAEDPGELRSKRKVITTLLPYAVWQERDGQSEMLDTFLHAAGASRMLRFAWYRVKQFTNTLLLEASSRAIVLTSPHIPWYLLTDRGDLVQRWVAIVLAASHTEEVAQSVVDTLLQIASEDKLLPYITVDVWSWLTKRPSLPPICLGRYYATYPHLVMAVRRLNDIEVLKSYLFLAWSEWDPLWDEGFNEICASIREDFGGIEMCRHRTDLIQRLVHILGQLDRGLKHLKQRNPNLARDDLQIMKRQYGMLEEILLEVESRRSSPIVMHFCSLTPAGIRMYRTSRNIYVRSAAPVSIVSWLEHSILVANSLFYLCVRFAITPSHYPRHPPAALYVFHDTTSTSSIGVQ
jgi:hypothetical protein